MKRFDVAPQGIEACAWAAGTTKLQRIRAPHLVNNKEMWLFVLLLLRLQSLLFSNKGRTLMITHSDLLLDGGHAGCARGLQHVCWCASLSCTAGCLCMCVLWFLRLLQSVQATRQAIRH